MKIRILGTGSGLPTLEKHLSSVLVENEGKKYLFDCGEGCSRQLLKLGITENEIDAVIITHFHPDHVSGILMLVQMLYLQGRTKDLPVWVPERAEEFTRLFPMFYTFQERLSFPLQILPMSTLSTHLPGLKAMPNDHLTGYHEVIVKGKYPNPMQAYSLRLMSDQGDFVYSSDLESTDSIAELYRGAHTLLVDAGHPSCQQILKLQDAGLKRILLTHEPSKELLEKIGRLDTGIFEMATEGVIYSL